MRRRPTRLTSSCRWRTTITNQLVLAVNPKVVSQLMTFQGIHGVCPHQPITAVLRLDRTAEHHPFMEILKQSTGIISPMSRTRAEEPPRSP